MNYLAQHECCERLDQFSVIGINYHKADAATRGSFAVGSDSYMRATEIARALNLSDLIILSTCNRTEVYGLASPEILSGLLCAATQNRYAVFEEHAYKASGMEAVNHLFKVAAGLDSQIIGDYEILMQLKLATKQARENHLLGTLLDRLVNFALQSSKRIKTETKLSTGTVSVSYAAIEVIRERIPDLKGKRILLVGAGKFGQVVARNINEYFEGAEICVINRSPEKAQLLASTENIHWAPYESLRNHTNESDVIIVNTAAPDFTITPEMFTRGKSRLILDLSVPANVDPEVKNIQGNSLMDVDEISAILDSTLAMRQAEVPKANSILQETIYEFVEWHKMFLHRHFLKEVKSKLYELSRVDQEGDVLNELLENNMTEAKIQKAVNTLAVDLKSRSARGCQYINTLSHYLQIR
ncbi:MAG: glutamyl-tRNA reductase [Bacteroidetes bacterium]|nr:MAG: glutamyl-tRNA reductase [Bacteroidota bacterium]